METQYSLIKQALNSEQEKLVMENIIFKYNTLSRKITKLEKVKKLQILNSNLEEINLNKVKKKIVIFEQKFLFYKFNLFYAC